MRWLGRRPTRLTALLERPRWLLVRDTALVLVVMGWLYFLAWGSEIARLTTLLTYSLMLLGLVALSSQLRLSVPRYAVGIVIAALLLSSTWLMSLNRDWLVSSHYVTHHFDVPLGAVNQVWHGRTILVDSTSQYGVLYPYIAAWALAPFGLSVKTVSTFFAVLSLLCWVLAYASVGNRIGYASIGTLAFITAFLGVTQATSVSRFLSLPDCQILYTTFPLRVISGMFFVWFVPIYLRSPRISLVAVGYIAAGFWLLWNADTGVVVLVAWFGLQVLRAIGHWRLGIGCTVGKIAGHAMLTALTAMVAVGMYMVFARLRSGQFPDLAAFGEYQRIFYFSGYMTLPMKVWEFWQPVILLYAVVVAWALRRAIWGTLTADMAWYFFIAIYGLGQFSYYQGRSHHENLTTAFFPAVLLGFLVAYDGWRAVRSVPLVELLRDSPRRWILVWAGLSAIWFAFGLMNSCRAIKPALALSAKTVPHYTAESVPVIDRGEAPPIHMQTIPPGIWREMSGKKGVVFGEAGNFALVAMGSRSALPFASPTELALLRQLRQVQRALESVDTEFVLVNTAWTPVRDLDLSRYRPVWQGDGLVVLKKKGT